MYFYIDVHLKSGKVGCNVIKGSSRAEACSGAGADVTKSSGRIGCRYTFMKTRRRTDSKNKSIHLTIHLCVRWQPDKAEDHRPVRESKRAV